MDSITNVTRQQQPQTSSTETQGKTTTQVQQQVQQPTNIDIAKQDNEDTTNKQSSINSAQDVEKLVKDLNKALEPIGTNVTFGVDSQDVFYVSVREASSNKEIRRFPAEQAQDFLPKMQEVSGILIDTKG